MSHACDCCGHRTLAEPPGRTGQICPVCFWEDAVHPELEEQGWSDSNGVTLGEAQAHFEATGACAPAFVHAVRPPAANEPRDPAWRRVAASEEASREEVLALIHEAFREVSRGGGVSLHEADAIDGYADQAGRLAARQKDTDNHWWEIRPEVLGSGELQSATSFFDPIGYRYHLPAYLVGWLDGTADSSGSVAYNAILWGLAKMNPGGPTLDKIGIAPERLAILDPAQRHAVARFLEHLARFHPWKVERADAQKALDRGWSDLLDPPAD